MNYDLFDRKPSHNWIESIWKELKWKLVAQSLEFDRKRQIADRRSRIVFLFYIRSHRTLPPQKHFWTELNWTESHWTELWRSKTRAKHKTQNTKSKTKPKTQTQTQTQIQSKAKQTNWIETVFYSLPFLLLVKRSCEVNGWLAARLAARLDSRSVCWSADDGFIENFQLAKHPTISHWYSAKTNNNNNKNTKCLLNIPIIP